MGCHASRLPWQRHIVVYAYQNAPGAEKVNVKPIGLRPDAMYGVSLGRCRVSGQRDRDRHHDERH